MKPTNEPRYLTIGQFRRRYFPAVARPTFQTVQYWITTGTANGVVLAGFNLDGEYYVDAERVEEFFAELQTRTQTRPRVVRRRSPAVRAERALTTLAKEFQL